jgi:hypothetical protein
VLQVHDQIAFIQFAEVDLRAMAFGAAQMTACVDRRSSKQFNGREDDQVCCWKAKSACQRPFNKFNSLNGARHDLAKALDLALGLKIDQDSGPGFTPLF